jgi:hypothetical protein
MSFNSDSLLAMVPDCENSKPSLTGSALPAAITDLDSEVAEAATMPDPIADRKLRLFIGLLPLNEFAEKKSPRQ